MFSKCFFIFCILIFVEASLAENKTVDDVARSEDLSKVNVTSIELEKLDKITADDKTVNRTKRQYYSYGYPYSYGYGYPSYSYSYPSYGYSYPSSYGYGSYGYPSYGYSDYGYGGDMGMYGMMHPRQYRRLYRMYRRAAFLNSLGMGMWG